jgi:hypothetical protein
MSNNSGKDQQSYISLGKLYNYVAIDMDILEQSHNSNTASALLSFYKDKDNRFVITQRDADAGKKKITLEIFKKGTSVLNQTLSEEGIADPKVLHYEDGAPIIKGNKIWVALTTRAYGTQLYQGVYCYDLQTKEWEIFTVSHRDDHMLYSGESSVDPRFGLVEISCSKVNYPSVGNEEDPTVIYDSTAGKWRMAICKAKGGYQTVLMEADAWNGTWSQIGVYTPTSSTGILIRKIGGQRYVFIGRGDTPCPMEVLTYPGMEKLGELNLSEHPEGKNIWPAIIPVTSDTGTAYYLLTFDRDSWTGPRTYGNIHWYYAEEFAKGFYEYTSLSVSNIPRGKNLHKLYGADKQRNTGKLWID